MAKIKLVSQSLRTIGRGARYFCWKQLPRLNVLLYDILAMAYKIETRHACFLGTIQKGSFLFARQLQRSVELRDSIDRNCF